jgi:uncharacterized protein (DUF1800 family)
MADAPQKPIDPHWAWQPYQPSKQAPWDLQRVGHLYRRAAFGATFDELQEGLKLGPEKAVRRLLDGGTPAEEFARTTAFMAKSIANDNNNQELSPWWLRRMLYGPHPLREKMTLFWHNHFATSNTKVQNTRFMLGQYELMRRHALGSFADMLREMSTDPAMMVWLDTRDSRKGNPNENYAREVMELFSLGVGNYTEKDIREAARAFTGWEIIGPRAVFNPKQHDDGIKTVLGQKGAWKADDIVRILLEQKAAANFIVRKLYRFLVSETVKPTPALLAPLAEQFRSSRYDFGKLVQTVLSSNLFFSRSVYRTRVKAPVDFVLGMVRGLEGHLTYPGERKGGPNRKNPIGTSVLATVLSQLGQNLFHPPSVKGWDGGTTWLNGQTFLLRQNLALAMTSTEDTRFNSRLDPALLVRRHGRKGEAVVDFFLKLFLQGDVPADTRDRLRAYQRRTAAEKMPVYWTGADADHPVRSLCHLVLTLPEYQLD